MARSSTAAVAGFLMIGGVVCSTSSEASSSTMFAPPPTTSSTTIMVTNDTGHSCESLIASHHDSDLSSNNIIARDTLAQAVDTLAQRQPQSFSNQDTPTTTTTVYLCPGLHSLAQPLHLDARHSNTQFVGLQAQVGRTSTSGTSQPAVVSG